MGDCSSERTPSLGRNQLVLDMANPEVIEYLFEKLSDVFSRAKVDYVKWDHNRNFSDSYAHSLSAKEQASFNHRYVLGLYDLLSRLTKASQTFYLSLVLAAVIALISACSATCRKHGQVTTLMPLSA
ncbi:alpha-galactosidase [Vibrio maritimus]|uniref:Alpha-galactosidase n=1 Tax=Vibrio maritimus TaxID=990268 RepID=A0A090T7F4_9VIBR|nr:alpha-galactosidase [Vibrio maritimus]